MAILRLLNAAVETTAEIEGQPTMLDTQDIVAGKELRSRRPNFNFEEMQIPLGSVLQFTESDATALVSAPRKVMLAGTEMSLTAATQELLQRDYAVQPGPYWTYQGRSLKDIYDDTYI